MVQWVPSTVIVFTNGRTKSVTLLYRALLGQCNTNLDAHRLKWAVELEREITKLDWARILQYVPKISRNARLRQIQLFCIHWAFLNPLRLSKMFPAAQDKCPRCDKMEAGLSHMIWDCPEVRGYKEEVVVTISQSTDRSIACKP